MEEKMIGPKELEKLQEALREEIRVYNEWAIWLLVESKKGAEALDRAIDTYANQAQLWVLQGWQGWSWEVAGEERPAECFWFGE